MPLSTEIRPTHWYVPRRPQSLPVCPTALALPTGTSRCTCQLLRIEGSLQLCSNANGQPRAPHARGEGARALTRTRCSDVMLHGRRHRSSRWPWVTGTQRLRRSSPSCSYSPPPRVGGQSVGPGTHRRHPTAKMHPPASACCMHTQVAVKRPRVPGSLACSKLGADIKPCMLNGISDMYQRHLQIACADPAVTRPLRPP